MPLGLLVLDRDMKIELVNQRFCSFVEIQSKSDLLRMHFVDYLHYGVQKFLPHLPPEEAEKAIKRWFESTRTGTKSGVELALGPDQIFTYTDTPFGDGRIVVTYTNITEVRKREIEISETRKALEQTGAILREASSVMEQGLIVIEDNNIIYVNEAYRDILNLPADYTLIDQNFENALRTLLSRGEFERELLSHSNEYRNFMNAFQQREYYTSVVYFEKLSRWVKVEIIPAGENRVVVVFNNVTELKLRERELEKMLIRAESADRAKSEFLTNMSHEIRTPMNGVLAMTGLLASTQLDTRQKTFLDVAMKSGKTLLTIINDVLDFSRMDGGQLELKHVVFSPAEAVEDVAMLMASRAADRKLDFLIDIDPTLPGLLRSDAGRFRQIVTNLVSNAIKFTDSGHVAVKLKAETGSEHTCELIISIEDTGMGIPEEKLATIEQAIAYDGANGYLYPMGAGLGLPITIGLIRLFGGKLAFKTDPVLGTSVEVRLPMAVESMCAGAFTTPSNIKGRRLLVIDDYDISCDHIIQMAEAWGFDVAGARSGQEGLDILALAVSSGLPVDVVLVDYSMKDMAGLEIAREIRSNPQYQSLDIILIADLDQIADDGVLNALKIGAVVSKPVRRSQLHESLINVLEARHTEAVAPDVSLIRSHSAVQTTDHNAAAIEKETLVVPTSSDKVTLLVAEDNDINKIVFSQILTALNVSFFIVSNGIDAIDAWSNLAPSLILMDIDMPVMDGYSATRSIRQSEKATNSRVAIIGVTPHADQKLFEACLEAGMDDCLSKPLSPERLEAMIAKWTRAAESRQTA